VGLANSQVNAPNLLNSTKYYWRVRAYNTLGQYSNWTTYRYFRVAYLPPVLVSPGADVPNTAPNLHTRRPTFIWDAVPGAANYTLEVSTSTTFAAKVITKSVTGTSYTHTSDLAANTYYWRVKANGANGPSLYSSPLKTFQTGNSPSIPTLASPANNALVTISTPLLNWNNSTVSTGAPAFYEYEIQIATNNSFTSDLQSIHVAGQSNSETTTPALHYSTTYYWRVRSWNIGVDGDGSLTNDNDVSSWSAVRYFRVAFAAPINLSPANGAVGVPAKPTFTWDTVTGATSYTIQISRNNTFTQLVVSKNVYAATYIHTSNLPLGTYYWRACVNGLYGPGAWSPVFSFETP